MELHQFFAELDALGQELDARRFEPSRINERARKGVRRERPKERVPRFVEAPNPLAEPTLDLRQWAAVMYSADGDALGVLSLGDREQASLIASHVRQFGLMVLAKRHRPDTPSPTIPAKYAGYVIEFLAAGASTVQVELISCQQ